VHVEENEGNLLFKRLYVCLKAHEDIFVSCKTIIGVDDCFLKGKYGDELLTVVGRDGNDQMLPLAYAVVEVENKETWSWFLDLMIRDLRGPELCSTYTFISDQQKVSNNFFPCFEFIFHCCAYSNAFLYTHFIGTAPNIARTLAWCGSKALRETYLFKF